MKRNHTGNRITAFLLILFLLLSFAACSEKTAEEEEEESVYVPAVEKEYVTDVTDPYTTDDNLSLPSFSYTLNDVHEVDGRQGIAWENGYFYVSGNTTISVYDRNWTLRRKTKSPLKGIKASVNHIGDIDVYKGQIYAGIEYFNNGSSQNPMIAVYDVKTLERREVCPLDSSSGQKEISGIAVDPDNRILWICSWASGKGGWYLYKYDLQTKKYIGRVRLQAAPQQVQGIAYYDGWIYFSSDDGTADYDEPDHVYRCQVDPSLSAFRVYPECSMEDVIMQGEVEGITFDKENKQMLISYNRGIRIIDGVSYGYYPGYTKEVREIYVYDAKRIIRPMDYADERMWVTKPSSTVHDADVFLILPEVNEKELVPDNADVTNTATATRFARMLVMEKGLVSDVADIYAPFYRQATIGCYVGRDGRITDDKALNDADMEYDDIAYRDIRDAWLYYAEHENNGRPVVLFGYSEGADMVMHLLKEFGDDGILSERLIAAYAIGTTVSEESMRDYPFLKMAGGEEDTGVIVSFNAVDEEALRPDTKELSINPLNWKTDGTPAGKEENKGYVTIGSFGNVLSEYNEYCGAYLDEGSGKLIVTGMDNREDLLSRENAPYGIGDYHRYDLNFFYRNLKENVSKRVRCFCDGKKAE